MYSVALVVFNFLFSFIINVPELANTMALSNPALQMQPQVVSMFVEHVYGHGTKYMFLDVHDETPCCLGVVGSHHVTMLRNVYPA